MAIINKVENPYFLDKYLEISTARVLVLNPVSKQEIFMCEMSADELIQKVDEEKIKSDIDNHTLAVINKNKEITFKATEVVTRKELQLAKLQATIKTGNVQAWHFPKQYTVKTGLTITLDQIPIDQTEVNIYDNITKKRLDTSKYTIVGKVVTFTVDSGAVETENILVTSYQFSISADYADIGSDAVPSVVSLIIMKPVFDTNDTIAFYKQYFFPKAKMDANITLKGETEKKNNPEETSFTIMKSDSYNYLGRMMYIPASAIDVDDDAVIITPLTDLNGNGGALKANLSFSAIAQSATNVTLKYKKSTISSYSNVATTGTTGVYIIAPLDATSTTAEVLGLDANTTYNFKITYVIDSVTYESNIDTEKTTV